MRTRYPFVVAATLGGCLVTFFAAPALAQYGASPTKGDISGRPPGENYHVEVSGGFWNPSPQIAISSESLGIAGTEIDFVSDLGIEQRQFTDLKVVLRPTTKAKFRLGYTPIQYTGDTILTRDLVFNAQRYRVSLPVASELSWKQWRVGFEYDFVYRDKGFAGFIVDVKFTDVNVELSSPFVGTEFAHAQAPIPAIGVIGRYYFHPNVAVTFELTALKVPRIDDEYEATFIDWDLNGTFNFNRYVGAQVGFRNLNVNYLFEQDTGDMTLRGLYFGGVARF